MSLFAGEKVYDDSNFKELVGDGTSVIANGERRLLSRMAPPKGHNPGGYSAVWETAFKKIPRTEWDARIEEQIKLKTRISDYQRYAPMDQDGLPTCWTQGPCGAFMATRAIMNLPHIDLSGCSLAVPISGGHSGGYEGVALKYLVEHGAVSTKYWGNNDTSKALMKNENCIKDRLNHKALEVYQCKDDFDVWATACLLSQAGAFAYDWMSHVMMTCDLVKIEGNSYGLRIRNSWGNWGAKNEAGFFGYAVYREGKGTPDSGFALRQVTASPV